ncbi:MAG TPA: LCP family protein [Gaiellaceae bacterium]|nr:LCP family protein [Gaiellaceae bacterium]
MRTTLKRGIGRAGGLNGNGNGHSAAPPLFGPITRYRQPEPPHRSVIALILRGFGWLVLAVAVLASGVAGGLYLYTHESVAALRAPDKSPTGRAVVGLQGIKSPSEPAIALIAGYDHRAGTGTNSLEGSNSDTLMLVRADPTNHTLSLLSFPRDLYVPIYCRGDVVYTHSRINSAWSICPGNNGPAATLNTMEKLTHLPINYLITVDFHAFKQLVNQLHGVYMNVDRRYYIAPHSGTSAINLHPGYQKLDGGQALSYVRFRHFDSDIYRTGRQQLFTEALKARMKTELSLSKLPFELPKLIHVLKHNLEYVKAGGGQVGIDELESYLGIAYHLPPGHLFRNQIPINDFQYPMINGASLVTAPASAVTAAVQSFLHPNVNDANRVNAQIGHLKPKKVKKRHPLPKAQISVLVLNAGHVAGQASNTNYLLTTRGYTTKTLPSNVPANAPKVRADTTVFYDPVQPNAQQAAQQLRPLFGSHTDVEPMTTAIAGYAKQAGNPLTVVAVGTTFGGKLVVPHRVKPLPKLPAKVSAGRSETVPRLRGLTHKVHFPVLAPYRIAQYSQLDSPEHEGVRVFKPLRGKHEVALTFFTPDSLYWQIEETDWTSAPILANPSLQIPWHHNKLLLYTTGGAIQMVALRTPKAVYMVVNTILNQLSNSTMLAIAKSLKPVGR